MEIGTEQLYQVDNGRAAIHIEKKKKTPWP